MIRFENITKKYDKLKALNGISVVCPAHECIALIGPNGSGKTTFMKSILGMVVPDSGKLFFDHQDISGHWKYRTRIGYMPQIGRYPENMTIEQVIDMMKDIRKNENPSLDEELIHQFQLPAIYSKKMGTLSGGTRQKVSASLAFLFNADVLILDEPTAGLDPLASEILKEKILKERQKGKLILISSHILSELDEMVTWVIYMQEGHVKYSHSIASLKSETGETKLARVISQLIKNEKSHA